MTTMRVTASGIFLGQLNQNVWHFNNPDGGLTHDQVKQEVLDNFIFYLRNLQNAGYSWTSMIVQKVDGTPDLPTVYSLSGQAGVFSGAGAHVCLAALFSIRTPQPGRHGHGRFYMGGVHGSSVVDSVMPSATLTNYQSKAASIVARFKVGGAGPLQLVVCRRSNPADKFFMTDIVVRPVFGIQRRRNIGVGA